MKNILHHGTKELCGTGVTGGFLETAHTINGFLIQIFGPEIQPKIRNLGRSGHYNCHNFLDFFV
jgi:hypothetical protein